jgi:hypothetical protein
MWAGSGILVAYCGLGRGVLNLRFEGRRLGMVGRFEEPFF